MGQHYSGASIFQEEKKKRGMHSVFASPLAMED